MPGRWTCPGVVDEKGDYAGLCIEGGLGQKLGAISGSPMTEQNRGKRSSASGCDQEGSNPASPGARVSDVVYRDAALNRGCALLNIERSLLVIVEQTSQVLERRGLSDYRRRDERQK